jgi:opacity protein-like surface antigen
MKSFIALIAMAALAFSAASAQDCDGTPDGQNKVSGAYYYTCTAGTLKPAGCLSDTQTQIPIGGTYTVANIQKTCVLKGDALTTDCTACVTDDGTVVQKGATTDSGTVYLACNPNGDSLDLQVAGCISNGARVDVNAKTVVGQQVLMCQRQSNKVATLASAGCVDNNGQTYDIGSEYDTETAVIHCANSNGIATAKPVGCVNKGKKIYDLDLFQDGDVFWRCRVGDDGVSKELFGCAVTLPDGTVEPKSVACTWDIGQDPINIVKCCIKDKTGLDTAKVTDLYCLYTYNGGRIQIDDGCYRIFPGANGGADVAAGCLRQSDGSLEVQTFDPKSPTAYSAQLHQCGEVNSNNSRRRR